MTAKAFKIVRPDSKGRITLGRLANGISSYKITEDKHKRIILEPRTEVPLQEKWLFDHKTAFKQVAQGLKDSAEGRVKSRGSFTQFIDDDHHK